MDLHRQCCTRYPYRQLDQGEKVDDSFFRQLEKASKSQTLVITDDPDHPSICWKGNMDRRKQSMRFLDCIENFLDAGDQ